jgi:hypothetical protein
MVKENINPEKLAFEKDTKGGWIFQPMGFIKLTLLDEETILKRQQQEAIEKELAQQKAIEEAKAEAERLDKERIAQEEAKKPKLFDGQLPKSKTVIVDAIITKSGKPNMVKLFVKDYENREFP